MSHSREQLVINFDDDQDHTGQSFESRFESHSYILEGPTDDEIDRLADQLGSYNEAYRVLGISREDVKPIEQEVIQAQETKNVGPAVSLGERAVRLASALDSYSAASSLEGLIDRIDSGIERRWSLENVISSRDRKLSQGNKEFTKAFGLEEMTDAGYDEDQIESATGIKTAPRQFRSTFVGPENEKQRRALRKSLKKWIRQVLT